VECVDGPAGRATQVIINYTTKQVTHLVVTENGRHRTDHLVPVDQVLETTPDMVRLRCTREELAAMEPFTQTEYLRVVQRHLNERPFANSTYGIPVTEEWIPVKRRRVPVGETVVRHGTRVRATDGCVGRVEGFLVDLTNGHITHIVLREGPLWDRKDVTIPASQISYVGDGVIRLKLDKHGVQSLPAVPARRHSRRAWRTGHSTSSS
jgi:sporulation protein YlmC with PRC-barrel domain